MGDKWTAWHDLDARGARKFERTASELRAHALASKLRRDFGMQKCQRLRAAPRCCRARGLSWPRVYRYRIAVRIGRQKRAPSLSFARW